MTEQELIKCYPRVWHIAEEGSWPAIRDHGLMSTAALLDAYGIKGDPQRELLSERRLSSVRLETEALPGAVLRDQKPISPGKLAACLQDGLTPADWFQLLNAYAFFWLSRARLRGLLNARVNRPLRHTVITVDTASLIAAHREQIRLSPINSGSTLFKPQPRGLGTFQPVASYPFAELRRKRGATEAVVELLVKHSVRDMAEHARAVHTVGQDGVEELWRHPLATSADHPDPG